MNDQLKEQRYQALDNIYSHQYNFGPDIYVESSSGWEHTTGSDSFSKKVFASFEDDDNAETTFILFFTIIFEPQSADVKEVYALNQNGCLVGELHT
jgi:hypothetical protein